MHPARGLAAPAFSSDNRPRNGSANANNAPPPPPTARSALLPCRQAQSNSQQPTPGSPKTVSATLNRGIENSVEIRMSAGGSIQGRVTMNGAQPKGNIDVY